MPCTLCLCPEIPHTFRRAVFSLVSAAAKFTSQAQLLYSVAQSSLGNSCLPTTNNKQQSQHSKERRNRLKWTFGEFVMRSQSPQKVCTDWLPPGASSFFYWFWVFSNTQAETMALWQRHDKSSLALLNQKRCLAAGRKTGFSPREKGQRKSHTDLCYLPMLDRLPTCTLRMQIPDITNLLEEQAIISSKEGQI